MGTVEDFRGELIHPGDPSYDEYRAVWNGSIDRRPGVIARCTGAADIRSALAYARRAGRGPGRWAQLPGPLHL